VPFVTFQLMFFFGVLFFSCDFLGICGMLVLELELRWLRSCSLVVLSGGG
jgi:hypothetical protein